MTEKRKRVRAPDWYVEARDGKVVEWLETYSGEVIGLKTVSHTTLQTAVMSLRQQWLEQGKLLSPPQFKPVFASGALGETAEVMGDQEIWVPHEYDPETGRNTLDDPEDPKQTAINWALWHKYERDAAAFEEAAQEHQFRVFIGTGVVCDFPEDDEWVEDLRFAGIEVGDDKRERTFARVWHQLTDLADKQVLRMELEMLSVGRMATPDMRFRIQEALQSAMEGPILRRLDQTVSEGIRDIVENVERRFEELDQGGGEPEE